MSREVSEEPRAERGREPRARELLQGLREAGVLGDEEVVVAVLQVKRMEGEEHTCGAGKTETASARRSYGPCVPEPKASPRGDIGIDSPSPSK